MLSLYRRLLALRREHADLASGALSELRAVNGTLYYERHGAHRHAMIARLSDTSRRFNLPSRARPVLSSLRPDLPQTSSASVELASHEAVLVELL